MARKQRALKLPDILREHRQDIEAALAKDDYVSWPSGASYVDAEQPRAIGGVIVDAIHAKLANSMIGYLYKEKMPHHDRALLAKASKVGGKLQHFTHLDFMIEVNWSRWVLLDRNQRLALMDHELSHFDIGEDAKGNPKNVLKSHDIEEFGHIVRRWGLWKRDLKSFEKAIRAGAQIDVFEPIL